MTFSGIHVLVVEDEPIIAFGLEDLLIEHGASVTVATSLDEASETLRANTFQFAILDVNLHGQKSYPVAQGLRERGVRFVFATGYGDAEHPEDFRDVPTVTKPYTIEQIELAAASAGG